MPPKNRRGKSLVERRSSPAQRAGSRHLLGLCFSGGGIRSATFCLGVLHALAELRILTRIDYLSTVSGGGYIGSWLTAWCSRTPGGIRTIERWLSPEQSPDPQDPPLSPVQFLRDYSNYLAPRTGFFSADTWTIGTVWLRNALLNQIVIVLLLAALLLVPYSIALLLDHWQLWPAVAGLLVVLLVLVVRAVGWNLGTFDQELTAQQSSYAEQGWVLWFIVSPAAVSAMLGSLLLWWRRATPNTSIFKSALVCFLALWVLLAALNFAGKYAAAIRKARNASQPGAVWEVAWTVTLSAAIGAAATALVSWIMSHWDPYSGPWGTLVFGPMLGLFILAATVVAQIGLLGRDFPDDRREWWSRLGAWLFVSAAGWALLSGIVVYGPWLIAKAEGWAAVGGAGWLASTWAGLVAGSSAETSGTDGKKSRMAGVKEVVATIAPYIFILGVLLALSYAIYLLLLLGICNNEAYSVPSFGVVAEYHWTHLRSILTGKAYCTNMPGIIGPNLPTWLWGIFGAGFVVALGLCFFVASRVDVNEFSLHHFYKNRLVRCYLGASRARRRQPNPFTGFDGDDDVKLASLRLRNPKGSGARAVYRYIGPYPIVNTALNVTGGEKLAWQERKAESFIFTPHFAGFPADEMLTPGAKTARSHYETAPNGYRKAECFGRVDNGVALGTAVAISGAAVNPNMGYHSSPAVAFLLTLFNVRLGWWFGNPRHKSKHQNSSPRIGLVYLLRELTGNTTDRSHYVNLSDGGHFDNLGIYELVRRRCTYIIACDGEADPSVTFNGLANVVRKCRIDFGVEIDIRPSQIIRIPGENNSTAHCAVGTITYPGTLRKGHLIDVKSSVTGDEPTDVLEYRSRMADFPHQSTGDQFFDESQFESYRKIGYHIGRAAFERAAKYKDLRDNNQLEQFATEVTWQWTAPPVGSIDSFVEIAKHYDEVLDRFRKDPALHAFGGSVFQGPAGVPEPVKYAVLSMIQLMENAFLKLHLDDDFAHPVNAGWIEMFNDWATDPAFRSVWATTRDSYGERFRLFCRDRLALP